MRFPPLASAFLSTITAGFAIGPAAGFASPQQPWVSPDGNVHLLRPIIAIPQHPVVLSFSSVPLDWRLRWEGESFGPGRLIVRFVLKEAPIAPETAVFDVLQIGVSRDPQVVRSCLTFALHGGDGKQLPDRIINGRRFTVWTNGDAGMSQGVRATDLRTVVDGACYAVERFQYEQSGGDVDPAITLSQADGARQLDAALASLQLGPIAPSAVLRPPLIVGNGHGVAR